MRTPGWAASWTLLAQVLAVACGNSNVSPTPVPGPQPTPTPSPPVTLVGAGDIAQCENDGGTHAEATARLIEGITDATVFTAGDNAYPCGTAADFRQCYAPRWGRFFNRTYPSPGNHEYECGTGGSPYFDYFGDRAGQRGAGFYSYGLANWHIIALNSNVGVTPGQEQYAWLQADLEQAKNDRVRCTLVYWHHPVFTSGPSAGSGGLMRPIWELLYQYGVDVVVNGHDHLYERFAPQDANGRRDPLGPAEYIVGTGGASLYDFGPRLPNSLFGLKAYGIVRFTLRDVGWDSVFISAENGLSFDATTNNLCH
jgi:acid phosphatase type 7